MLFGEYIGNTTEVIKEYRNVSASISKAYDFKSYIFEQISHSAEIPTEDIDSATAQMQQIFANLENLQSSISALKRSDFTTSRPITNTKTEIEFADYAAKFMPAGVTPIACYVGECGARYIDYKYFVEYFGIGYYSMVKTTLVFMNNDGSIAVSEYEFIVRALNNKEASESIYNRLLNGNETTDYVVSNIDTTTIENPIWTGYTVGVTK